MLDFKIKALVFKMIQVDRLHRNALDRKVQGFGLHRSQHQLLRYLLKVESSKSQKEIANDLDVSQAAIAKTIKTLEQKNLIKREVSEFDKRNKLIQISEKGKEIMLKSKKNANYVDNKMLNNIAEEDLEITYKVLIAMEENLMELGAKDPVNFLYNLNDEREEN